MNPNKSEQVQDILCRILEYHESTQVSKLKPYPGDWSETMVANALIIVRDHYRHIYNEVLEHMRLKYPNPIHQSIVPDTKKATHETANTDNQRVP